MADPVSPERERPIASKVRSDTAGPLHRRFGAAYLALAVVLGLAVGLFIVFVGRPGPKSGPQWSAFRPTEKGLDAAQQIADFVANRYRLDNRTKLVTVIARQPATPVSLVETETGQRFPASKSVFFQLVGSGDMQEIPGHPTEAQKLLLRSEILELSLYTFKYLHGVDSVVAIAPPILQQAGKKTKTVDTAAFVLKDAVEPQLHVPLARTIPQRTLTPRAVLGARLSLAEQLRISKANFRGLLDGSVLLELRPISTR